MIFPIEIWEQIFAHCQAKDLYIFKYVCSDWYILINKMFEKKDNDKWYKQCMDDIPSSDLDFILEKLLPYSDGINFDKYTYKHNTWKAVYRSWMQWKKLSNDTKCLIEPFCASTFSEREVITCLTTSGNIIAVGSNFGYVKFYDVNKVKRKPFCMVEQGYSITDVKILEYDDFIFGITLSCDHSAKIWDLVRNVMIYEQNADAISVSHGYCYLLWYNTLTVKKLLSCEEIIFDDVPKFVALAADKNKLLLWSLNGINFKVSINGYESNIERYYVNSPLQQSPRYKGFKSGLAFCIAFNGILSISINFQNWIYYNIHSFLQAKLMCLNYYNRVLIFGLETGCIIAYRIDDLNQLKFMDFSRRNACLMIDVCELPISSVDILEHEQNQFIIATCEKNVYIIQLIF